MCWMYSSEFLVVMRSRSSDNFFNSIHIDMISVGYNFGTPNALTRYKLLLF
jgi:hypothetical protein